MFTNQDENTSKYFECKKCDFICSKKGDWTRHINSLKHIKMFTDMHKTYSINYKDQNTSCSTSSYLTCK